MSTKISSPPAMTLSAFLPSPALSHRHMRRRRVLTTPCLSASPSPAPAGEHPAQIPSDWRSFRAHLAASTRAHTIPWHHNESSTISTSSSSSLSSISTTWAHAIPQPEVGACLVARPSHIWPRAFAHLDRSVILLTEHCTSSSRGTTGLLLTRPTGHTVCTLASARARAGSEFDMNSIWLGGDCSTGTLEMLHGLPSSVIDGANQIIPGIWSGGMNAARKAVRDGRVEPDAFRFFVAYARWTAQTLQAEMDRGAWGVVACAPGMLLGDMAVEPDALWNQLRQFV